jgi:hypothetical protein
MFMCCHCGTLLQMPIMCRACHGPGPASSLRVCICSITRFCPKGRHCQIWNLFKEPLKGSGVAVWSRVVRGEPGVRGVRGTRAAVCALSLSPICGSRTHFFREGVKLDSDYSGSASHPIFSTLPPCEDLFPSVGAFRVWVLFFRSHWYRRV